MGKSHPKLRQLQFSRLSQSSLEYLLIVALTFAIIVPTTYLFYNYSKESTQEISDSQVTKLGRSIVDSAESIFYSGQGSKTTLELNVPDNVRTAQIIDGRELIFNASTNFGTSEIVFFSRVNITAIDSNCYFADCGAGCNTYVCNLPELASSGLKNVKVEAITQNTIMIQVI